tara:strand:+ start:266 stop:1069 length:804 start_codon:yes stop_codon:yes gene_type:complete
MDKENNNEGFSFEINGKDYIISEKNISQKKVHEKKIHAQSLTIGAIISGICIAVLIFGVEAISEEPQELIETQLIEEEIKQPQIPVETFFANASPILGNPNAAITLVEFGDYQCHFCNVYFQDTEHKIVENFVDTGKVKIMFKDFTIIGPDSVSAAHFAHCASEQEKFWEYHNILYNNWAGENNGWASNDNLLKFADEIGLDMNELKKCNNENRYKSLIESSNSDARSLGLTGTPAFFVITNNGAQKIHGAQPYEVFENVFETLLEK